MKSYFFNKNEPSIYPGGYYPALKESEVERVLRLPHKKGVHFPVVHQTEMPDAFKFEVDIPGYDRSEFFVQAEENLLSICVIHKEADFNLQEKTYDCLETNIQLPDNADSEFVSAEYKNGTLCILTPKNKQPKKNRRSVIVVY